MAVTRGQFFRELIFEAIERCKVYNNKLSVLYYIDDTKIPFCYVNVENEQINQRNDVDGSGADLLLDMQNSCSFILRLFFDAKDSKDITEKLNAEGDKWIEYIEYELLHIDTDTSYTHVMFDANYYEVNINSIQILRNERNDDIKNEKVQVLSIFGQINYSITYL